MGRMKDLFIELVERRTQVLIDSGMNEEDAYNLAQDTVGNHDLADHLAERADRERDRRREEDMVNSLQKVPETAK
jgi:hypothetical protein